MRTIKVLLLLLIITAFSNLHAQIAVVSDIRVGTTESEKVVRALFEDISKKYINEVVFLGDLTNSGQDKEFDEFDKLLDYLTPDNYIIPGARDIQNNPTGYYYSRDQFDGTRVRLDSTALLLAGLSNYSPRSNMVSFFNTDIKWIDSLFNKVPQDRVILFFSPASLEKTDNWYKLYNLLSSKENKFLFTTGGENTISNFRGIEQFNFRPSVEHGTWNYNVLRIDSDSLDIFNYRSDSTVVEWASLPVKSTEVISPVDTTLIQNYSSEIIWQKEIGKDLTSPVLVTENRIYYSSLNGEVECLDLNGKSIWTHNIGRTVTTPPVRDKDLIILGTVEGDLFSINANNGNIVQIIGTGEALISDPILVDVENLDGKFKGVVLGTPSGRMLCYDIYSFEPIWDINELKGKINSIKALNGKLYVTSGSVLYSFDWNNGTLIWKWNAGKNVNINSFEPTSKYIFVSTSNKMLYGIDILLGSTVWKKPDNAGAVTFKLSDTKNQLVIKTLKDELTIVDPSTGNIITQLNCGFPLDNEPSSIIFEGEDILFSSADGKIRRIVNDSECKNIFLLGGGYLNTLTPVSNGNYLIANDQGDIISVNLKKQ